jgi:hypothetical protein
VKLRIARATNDLERISGLYQKGLGLNVIGSFQDHAGFDGVMLGSPQHDYHFEFTKDHNLEAPRSNSNDNLIIFYLPQTQVFEQTKNQMIEAGFKIVLSHNPYWDEHGITFEDFEGYRVVLCRQDWPY